MQAISRFEDAKPKGLRHTNLVRGSAGNSVAGFLGLLHFPQIGTLSAATRMPVMPTLETIQLPIPYETFGLPSPLQTRSTCLVDGPPGWGWDGVGAEFGIPTVTAVIGQPADGWDLDHVVLLVPDIEAAVAVAQDTLGRPRLQTEVKGRPTAFYRVGPLLEMIQSPVRAPALYGIALVTIEPLEVVTLRWRSRGLDVTDPKPAIQPGRRIITVKGTEAGLAVMSPDGPAAP